MHPGPAQLVLRLASCLAVVPWLGGHPIAAATDLGIRRDPATGHYDFLDGGRLVLRYNHGTNAPGDRLSSIAPDNIKYAVGRGAYLHPLVGPEGESLTRDWSLDHPHHRGIYWAWPEVDWRGQRGDLHALQRVFDHPAGTPEITLGDRSATLQVDNEWRWDHVEPVVRERVRVRLHAASDLGRWIDLDLRFEAVRDPVDLARRGTELYGGLNVRLASVRGQEIRVQVDAAEAPRRAAWAQLGGVFEGATRPAALVLFQHPDNPDYPGDWVQYPELNWLQPTFPARGTRHRLEPGRPLRLRYRLWIHPGGWVTDDLARSQWNLFADSRSSEP